MLVGIQCFIVLHISLSLSLYIYVCSPAGSASLHSIVGLYRICYKYPKVYDGSIATVNESCKKETETSKTLRTHHCVFNRHSGAGEQQKNIDSSVYYNLHIYVNRGACCYFNQFWLPALGVPVAHHTVADMAT